MDIATTTTYTVMGLTFGLAGGLSPGPLTALVIGQTIRFGRKEGFKVALAPVITDGPLLIIAMFILGEFREFKLFTGIVSLVGAMVLIWLAVDTFRAGEIKTGESNQKAGSVTKAVLTNLSNPHPYIFWFTIGAPVALKALEGSALALCGFLAGFGLAIVSAKVVIAVCIDRYRNAFSGPAYRWTMRTLGLLLLAVAVQFAMDGIHLL